MNQSFAKHKLPIDAHPDEVRAYVAALGQFAHEQNKMTREDPLTLEYIKAGKPRIDELMSAADPALEPVNWNLQSMSDLAALKRMRDPAIERPRLFIVASN